MRLVEKALHQWPETRSDDKKLIMAVWYLQDSQYESHFKQFFKEKAMSPESITRARRKLQEQGKYPAVQEVEEQRFNLFRKARATAGQSVLWEHE